MANLWIYVSQVANTVSFHWLPGCRVVAAEVDVVHHQIGSEDEQKV